MHIPNANILEMVKDKTTNTIVKKYEIIYCISIAIFTFDIDQF